MRSARIDAELKWSQRAKFSEGRTDRVEREIRIRQEGATKWDFPKTIREVEYTRNVPLTSEQRKRDLPAYFREGRNCIRLSISFQVSRNRLDLSAPGLFYYPLGAVRSRTGFPFSICAPFEMNEDRSQLVDPGNSDWNRWLVTECARVAIDLLKSEFFPNYGADAYRAFDVHSAAASTLPELVDHIRESLTTESCWPSRATVGRSRRPVYAIAANLTTPFRPDLSEIVADCRKPSAVSHAAIAATGDTKRIIQDHDGLLFTPSSMVRLWCAGKDSAALSSRPGKGETDLHFIEYPEALNNLTLQRKLATALDAIGRDLTDAHRADLRRHALVLTAANTLELAGRAVER